MDDTPIPREELDRARRKMCRRIAAALVGAMAETDTGFDTIAARLGRSEASCRAFLRSMIDGTPPRNGLDLMSDFAFAMGCEIEFRVVKRTVPPVDAAGEGKSDG